MRKLLKSKIVYIISSFFMSSAFVALLYKIAGSVIISSALAIASTTRSSWLIYEADIPEELQ